MASEERMEEVAELQPRQYQLQLLDFVLQRNAIVYLPTGAGKTFVAIMAIRRFSSQMQCSIENGGKRAIFMCNTIELARQQAVEIRKNTNLKVGFYIGERDVDSWSRARWAEEIKTHQVLVGTAQIFVDIITQNLLKITDLSVVIIDECHHTTKNHPMHEFMRLFQHCDPDRLPRVIGLSGVLLKGNFNTVDTIVARLLDLETTFRGTIVTVNSIEQYNNVMLYSTKPREELVTYESNVPHVPLFDAIKKQIDVTLALIETIDVGPVRQMSKGLTQKRLPNKKSYVKNLLHDFLYQMTDFGVYAASIAILSPLVDFEMKKRQAVGVAYKFLYRAAISCCELISHMLTMLMKSYNDKTIDPSSLKFNNPTADSIMFFSSPKLRSLLSYIYKNFANKDPKDICCLIFVDRRYTAKCLYFVISRFIAVIPSLREAIRPQFMIGRNSIVTAIEHVLDNKWNKKAIDSFRAGECNLIICSNVLEEGIDVQACNFVLAIDPLKTFNSYVQTKGRARSESSIYAVFAPSSNADSTVHQIEQYEKVHKYIREFLEKHVIDRADADESVVRPIEGTTCSFVTRGGARLLMTLAVKTLYQYCQMLPSDAFGFVNPWFSIVNYSNKGYVVALDLPMQSLLKETIYSDPMATTRLGKFSAAFKACKMLYEIGELNDHLLPITKRECVAKVSAELFQHWHKYDDDVTSKVAGKQLRRTYDRMCPDELFNSMPVVGEQCYAYSITCTPHFQKNEFHADIARLLSTTTTYAFLLRKKFPRLAEMPFFMSQGRLSVKVAEEPIVFTLESTDRIEQLRQFHYMIFRDILKLWKNFFVADKRNMENSFLIVPLNAYQEIDWTLINRFPRLAPQHSYSVAERLQHVYRPEDFLGKVINKWYAGDEHDRYIVTKVLMDHTPLSVFGSDEYETYLDFFEGKYRHYIERVVQRDQFLIEVCPLTRRRNFFINATGKSLKQISRSTHIILLPELCYNFEFPGDLWLKALLLPSILHRVHFMLHADIVRCRFNNFLGVDAATAARYRPLPLIIDGSLNRTMDADGNAIIDVDNEKKKVLSTLPAKRERIEEQMRTALANDGAFWKDYIEPKDYHRHLPDLFSIDIDYLMKFVSGELTNVDCFPEEDEIYTTSQLAMPPVRFVGKQMEPKMLMSSGTPKIAVLERTLGNIPITSVEQCDVVAALTTAGANDVFDMERFELLGDSFLKFSVSLFLANKYTQWHEGFLTEVKSKMVSNQNLVYCMLEQDLAQRICASLFKPHIEWQPPLCSLPTNMMDLSRKYGKDFSTTSTNALYNLILSDSEVESGICNAATLAEFVEECDNQMNSLGDNNLLSFVHKETMPDKVVADALEALLGVCVKHYGIHHSFRMLEYFGICKADKGEKPLTTLLDLELRSSLLRANISSKEVDGFLINYEQLEYNLGYKFNDRAFLLQALTHPSYPTNRLTGCYQELEFIGDAILDFLVSCYIFEQHANMTPGKLTDFRSALVNNVTLGCVCVRHRFHLFLLAENSILGEAIKKFADFQQSQGHRVTDQVHILMEETDNNKEFKEPFNLSVNVDVPKALGDIVEAIIAAVYLDSRDLKITWEVIYHLLQQEFADFSVKVPIDAVRQIYEHPNASPLFSEPTIKDNAVMVTCTFMCLDKRTEVSAFGVNAKQAKKSAAKHAMLLIYKNM